MGTAAAFREGWEDRGGDAVIKKNTPRPGVPGRGGLFQGFLAGGVGSVAHGAVLGDAE